MTSAQPRRTRPRNRRELVLSAAADLFARDGYDRTGMTDIAAAVGIGASALYRYFPGKHDLLAEVIATGLRPAADLTERLDLRDREAALSRLAALALDRRQVGVLWQREARHLSSGAQSEVRALLRRMATSLTDQVRALRGDLDAPRAAVLAWSMITVLTSPSFHQLQASRPSFDKLLERLLDRVITTPLPPVAAGTPGPRTTPVLAPASRREALLLHAVPLFAERGYSDVGMEDLGAAVGITGPSVYNHFPSKLTVLTTAIDRGISALFTDLAAAYTNAGTAQDALMRLLDSYLSLGIANPYLVTLLITELGQLPADDQQRARQAQREYLAEWAHLLGQTRPELSPVHARITVHAAVDVINGIVRVPRLLRMPGLKDALLAVCAGVLEIGQ